MDERQYSRAIDVHRISEYPEVQKVINSLLSELNDSDLIKNSPRKRILKHLKVVVLDLYVTYLGDPLVYVSYPRSKDAYRQDQRMKQLFLGYGPMTTVINGLASLGYLEDHRGFYDQGRKTGFQSRMRATSRLTDLIHNYDVVLSMISREEESVLLLRDKDGNDIPYPETEASSGMRDKLTSYNAFLEQHEIALSLPVDEVRELLISRQSPPIDYTRKRLCRIFSQHFNSGGRFYKGWWQEVPSELRPYLTIDGEDASELDYSGQHLLLLYALKDHEYRWLRGSGDPYDIKSVKNADRSLMKQVFLTCVNAESKEKAALSIRSEINKNYKHLKSTNEVINALIDATIKNHPELSDSFFTGAWAELQYQDSLIAEYVLSHMQARGQVALPVHDSFIVQDQHLPQLYATMKEAYRMLGIDSIPEVKIKKGANTTFDKPYFMELWREMDEDRERNEKELQALKDLEDYV
jgi:hypothetical protein